MSRVAACVYWSTLPRPGLYYVNHVIARDILRQVSVTLNICHPAVADSESA